MRWRQLSQALAVCCLLAAAGPARALVGGPAPGSVTAHTLKLPDGPGSIHGLAQDPSVSIFSGQVSYEVPIDLPKGPGGFGPRLGLSYSGELGNGPVGVGWSLGAAAIRRTVRHGVPTYTDADDLELTGLARAGRLVPFADGTLRLEGAPTTFRAQKANGGYQVQDPDGIRYLFGLTDAAREGAGDRVSGWLLQWIIFGNQTVELRYERQFGQVYLKEIVWGPAGRFHAQLGYQDRPDPTISFRTGYQVITARRLESIAVLVSGSPLCTYRLTYDDSRTLSRLAGVRKVGTDGSTAMPALSFDYAPLEPARAVPVPELDGWVLNDRGTSLADVDGDGMPDLLRLEMGNHEYRKNQGGWFRGARPIVGASGIQLESAQLMDLDGDARPELVHVVDDRWRAFSMGTEEWLPFGEWPGTNLVPLHADGSILADLNGDGRTDVVKAGTGGLRVWLNGPGGLGPVVSRPLIDPSNVGVDPGNPDVRFVDVNGDGLADAVWLAEEWMKIYLGQGDGTFLPYKRAFYPWKSGAPDGNGVFRRSEMQMGDLDRDGIADLVVFTAGNALYYRGLPDLGTYAPMRRLDRPEDAAFDAVVVLADANGNGSEDIVWSSPRGMWILDIAGGTTAGMMTRVDNGLGKVMSFGYTPSAQLAVAAENAGQPWDRKLPISMPVPTHLEVDTGGDGPLRVSSWNVRDGFWDGAERRFGGFLESESAVEASAARDVLIETIRYHEGSGDDRVLRGLPYFRQQANALGDIFRTDRTDWVAFELPDIAGGNPLLRRAVTAETRTFVQDGLADPVLIVSTFEFDDEGRVIRQRDQGRLDATGDERIIRREYMSDDQTWVRDRVCEERVYEADEATLRAATLTTYGDSRSISQLPCSLPLGLGLVRKVEQELAYAPAGEARTITTKTLAYDDAGNVIRQYEDGVTREYTYDDAQLFPLTETVHPRSGSTLSWQATWHQVQGVPLTLTDANGDVTSVDHDALGREITVAQNGRPAHIHYDYDWSAPRPKTTTGVFDGHVAELGTAAQAWPTGSKWRKTTAVANGAGEPLFTSTPLGGSWIVSGWRERDERGTVVLSAEPFTASQAFPTTRPGDPSLRVQKMSYDALGRLRQQTLPNGAARVITRQGLCQTVSQTDLAPVTSCADGLGRTARTSRVVSSAAETVDAAYDAMGRIREMRLQAGTPAEVRHTFDYDTLGRLRAAFDPDTGARQLSYDDRNFLVDHANGAGQHIRFEYDDIGRLTLRSETAEANPAKEYRYTYDDPGAALSPGCHVAGRLAAVTEPGGDVHLCYDDLGRQTALARTIVAAAGAKSGSEQSELSPSGLLLETRSDDLFAVGYRYDQVGRAVCARKAPADDPTKCRVLAEGAAGAANDDYWVADAIDAAGRITREHYGNGVIQTYAHDSLGLASRVQVTPPAGGAARLFDVSVSRTSFGAPSIVQDLDGRAQSLDHTATYTYDAAARLTDATMGAGSMQYGFTYRYDGLQNMTRRGVTLGGQPRDIGALAGDYRYGERGYGPRQLTSVAGVAGVFDYDRAGRQTSDRGTQLVYDGYDQLREVRPATPPAAGGPTVPVVHTYGFDGLRTSTSAGTTTPSSQYWFTQDFTEHDGRREHYVRVGDRLIARVTLQPAPGGGAGVVSERRDPVGAGPARRNLLLYLCFVASVFAALCAFGRRRRPAFATGAVAAFVLFACSCEMFGLSRHSDALVWNIADNLTHYFHHGIAPGPNLVTDGTGAVVEERRYEPFGQALDAFRPATGVGPVDYASEPQNILGKLTDPNTGWSYHGLRWMAPQTARWLTPDPAVKGPDPKHMVAPWDLNPYQYASQSPTLFWDPDGAESIATLGPVVHRGLVGAPPKGAMGPPVGYVAVSTGTRFQGPNGRVVDANMISMTYNGLRAENSKWLQFHWTEVEMTSTVHGTFSVRSNMTTATGYTFTLTNNPADPKWYVDTNSNTSSPFYDDIGMKVRSPGSITMFDHPGGASAAPIATNAFKQEQGSTDFTIRSHFETYLIQKGVAVYRVSWTATTSFAPSAPDANGEIHAVGGTTVYKIESAGPVNGLPQSARDTLKRDFPNSDAK